MPVFARERLTTPDGGILCLDWLCHPTNDKDNTPILLVVPGICNSIDSHYIRSFATEALKRNLRVVIAASRGVVELTTPKIFTFGGTDDLRLIINHVTQKYPHATIVSTGFSLGGNILCKYLGEMAARGESHPIIGAIAIGQGYDGERGIDSLKRNWMYDKFVSRKLTGLLQKNSSLFKDVVDLEHILKVSSVEDFDKLYTIKQEGFEETKLYYKSMSSIHHLHHIDVPLMLVNAIDDPIVDPSLIPVDLPQQNDQIIVVTTKRGGHLSWSEGFIRPNGHWHERLALEHAVALLDLAQKNNDADDRSLISSPGTLKMKPL